MGGTIIKANNEKKVQLFINLVWDDTSEDFM
jgi:hypothetical protein